MKTKELAILVYNMRQAQKSYFKTRDNNTLQEAKRLEKDVDAACKEILWGQPDLFAGLDGIPPE